MNFIRAENKETIDVLAVNVNACAATIEHGFDMRTEASLLRKIAQDISRGLFKILFMGKFNTGKSTIINALVGKAIMATKAVACTAVIAVVKYGNSDSVRVVYTPESKLAPRNITLEELSQNFVLTDEDERCVEAGEQLNRFAKVSHVELFSDNEFFADGTCLIDSPGLEDRLSCTNATNNFLPEANAVVFMLDAAALFSAKEREYISDNFNGKHMTNLFFLVNRVNQLVPGQLESSVIPGVKNGLKDVFVDENGRFDEKLYNRRVFFVDAYGAECARTGEPYKIKVGNREMTVPVELEDTGMVAFEDELRAFLNSDERIAALINSALAVMEINRDKAERKFTRAKKFRETAIHAREEELHASEKNLVDARKLIKKFSPPIESTADKISAKAYSYLSDSVEKIAREFESRHMDEFIRAVDWSDLALLGATSLGKRLGDVKNFSQRVGSAIGSKLTNFFGDRFDNIKKSATPAVEFMQQTFESMERRLDEQAKKSAEPIVKFMQAAIQDDLTSRMSHMTERIKLPEILAALEQNLDEQTRNFDLQLEKVTNVKDSLRSALIMSNWGINFSKNSRQLTGTLPITFEWFDSVVTTVTAAAALVISAVWLFLMPILPVIIAGTLVYCVKSGLDSDAMKKKLLSLIVSKTFDKLRDHLFDERRTIKANISQSVLPLMNARSEKIISTAQNLVEDADRTLKNLLAEKVDAAAAANSKDESNLRKLVVQLENIRGQLTRIKNY